MLSIGECFFEPASRRLLREEVEYKLSPKAAGVLLALAETPGEVWSRGALLERVWPTVHVGEEVLTQAIVELRRAFGDDPRSPRYLATIHKSGYRLVARLLRETLAEPPAARPESDIARWRDTSSPATAVANPIDANAYASYLAAQELCERGGRQSTIAAVNLFASLLEAHPDFALAHAGMAKALTFLDTYYRSGNALFEAALAHCASAHSAASGSADAFAVQGLIFAIAGRAEQSANCFRAAIQWRPDSAETHYLLARASHADLEFGVAAVMFEHAARLRTDDFHSLLMAGKNRLAKGEEQKARANYALALPRAETRLLADPSDFRALCAKARCLFQLGQTDGANDLLNAIAEHPDPLKYQLACTLAYSGQSERALSALEEAVESGWRHRAWLDRDPDFDRMRDNPRFRRIAASIT